MSGTYWVKEKWCQRQTGWVLEDFFKIRIKEFTLCLEKEEK
jgi:hypothetical protein